MSKWLKWKLIHRGTGLTFNQYKLKYPITDLNGVERSIKSYKSFAVILESGIPAVYVDQEYYPFLFFLNNKDWIVKNKNVPS